MKLTRCEKGHFYDADKYAVCPHCSGEVLKNDRLPDEEQPERKQDIKERPPMKIMVCEEGHFYNGNRYDGCPFCNDLIRNDRRNDRDIADFICNDDQDIYVDKPLVDGDDWRERIGIESPVIWDEAGSPRLEIVHCENGHFYNGEEYDVCPLCRELQQSDSSIPDARLEEKPLESKFARCKNGHTYNRELYARCPVCEKNEQEKKENREVGNAPLRVTITYCENGHYYDGELYASCPVCEKAEREKREKQETGKEQLAVKLVCCEKGHFYNVMKYNDCPYCSDCRKIVWTDSSVPKIRQEEKKNEGQKELRDFRSELKLMRCVNGHFYDGNKYAVCPHCGSAAPDDDDEKTII